MSSGVSGEPLELEDCPLCGRTLPLVALVAHAAQCRIGRRRRRGRGGGGGAGGAVRLGDDEIAAKVAAIEAAVAREEERVGAALAEAAAPPPPRALAGAPADGVRVDSGAVLDAVLALGAPARPARTALRVSSEDLRALRPASPHEALKRAFVAADLSHSAGVSLVAALRRDDTVAVLKAVRMVPALVAGASSAAAASTTTSAAGPLPLDRQGRTALHIATESDSFACVALLLEHGADPHVPAHNGMSSLMIAIERNVPDVLRACAPVLGRPLLFSVQEASPRPVFFPTDVTPLALSCGNRCSALLTDSGLVFTWGESRYGVLGHGEEREDKPGPAIVRDLVGHSITSIACGDAHMLAADSAGRVVGWGNSSHGRLGMPPSVSGFVPSPVAIESLARLRAVQVAAGKEHSLVLVDTGDVFAFGCSLFGRLGTGVSGANDELAWCRDPARVEFPLELGAPGGDRVMRVACGGWHSLAVTAHGRAFSWGSNVEGRCGQRLVSSLARPAPIESLAGHTITDACAGENFSVFLTSTCDAYTAGGNEHGQLGRAPEDAELLLAPVDLRSASAGRIGVGGHSPSVPPPRIRTVAAGARHCVALLEDGHVVIWGAFEERVLRRPYVTRLGDAARGGSDPETPDDPVLGVVAGGTLSFAIVGVVGSRLGQDLAALLRSGFRADVVLLAEDQAQAAAAAAAAAAGTADRSAAEAAVAAAAGDGGVRALRFVLEARCPRLLRGARPSLRLSAETPASGAAPLLVPVRSTEALRALVHHVYTDKIVLPEAPAHVADLADAARECGLARLADLCARRTRIAAPSLAADLLAGLSAQRFCDVWFRGTDGEIGAHSAVLFCRSAYFASMLTGGFRESAAQELVIDLAPEGFDVETLSLLLQFVYSDSVADLRECPTAALDLLPLAHEYQLDRLVSLCTGAIQQGVEIETAAYVWKITRAFHALPVAHFCVSFVCTVPGGVDRMKASEGFAALDEADREALLRDVDERRRIRDSAMPLMLLDAAKRSRRLLC